MGNGRGSRSIAPLVGVRSGSSGYGTSCGTSLGGSTHDCIATHPAAQGIGLSDHKAGILATTVLIRYRNPVSARSQVINCRSTAAIAPVVSERTIAASYSQGDSTIVFPIAIYIRLEGGKFETRVEQNGVIGRFDAISGVGNGNTIGPWGNILNTGGSRTIAPPIFIGSSTSTYGDLPGTSIDVATKEIGHFKGHNQGRRIE